MPLLVRKISPSKWPDNDCDIENFPGDAVSDIRTTQNTLSFWRIDSIEDLKNAIIALATARQKKTIEKIDVVWIPEETINQNGLKLIETLGDTAVTDLASTHRDICNITYSSLGIICKIVLSAIQEGSCKTISKNDVVELTKEAYQNGHIDVAQCSPELLGKLQ